MRFEVSIIKLDGFIYLENKDVSWSREFLLKNEMFWV